VTFGGIGDASKIIINVDLKTGKSKNVSDLTCGRLFLSEEQYQVELYKKTVTISGIEDAAIIIIIIKSSELTLRK